jgi:hypothetical protein
VDFDNTILPVPDVLIVGIGGVSGAFATDVFNLPPPPRGRSWAIVYNTPPGTVILTLV